MIQYSFIDFAVRLDPLMVHAHQDSSSKCNNKETTLTDMFVYFFLTVNDHKENYTNFYLSQPLIQQMAIPF